MAAPSSTTPPMMQLRVGAYAVIVDGDRVLLAHWSEGRFAAWTMPGGGLEPGEHPADAAVREVREETGFEAVLDGVLGVDSVIIRAADRIDPELGPLQALRIVYRAHIVGGELRDEADGSTDAAAWWPLAEVPGLQRVDLVDTALHLAGLPAPSA